MIVVKIATVERRYNSLLRVLDSLKGQADKIWVYQNDYTKPIPELSISTGRDLGDTGKIFPPHETGDVVFLCDDDISYPPDYIERMLAAIRKYQCIMGVHGAIMRPPIKNYFKDRSVFHFTAAASSIRVNVLGTGTVAYDSSMFDIDWTYPAEKNMLDVFFAIKAQNEKKQMRIIDRGRNWLRPAIKEDAKSLYQTRGKGELQTKWINTIQKWSIF